MDSWSIVQASEDSSRRLKNQEERPVPSQTLFSGRRSVAPLETRVQAIQLLPYHTGLAAPALATAFSPVCRFTLMLLFPLPFGIRLEVDPRTFLRVLAHCMGDTTPRDAAHSIPHGHRRPFSQQDMTVVDSHKGSFNPSRALQAI